MLTELLALLKERRARSLEELAELLQIGVPAVRAQIEYLERQGYIQKVPGQAGCGQSCHGCKGCSQSLASPVMWELK